MLRRIRPFAFALGLLPLALASCQDEMKDYYEEPDWLRGSIYEILDDEGNYGQFLAAIDRCGYTPLVKGRSILTVMAPNNASMNAYLSENYGTTNVKDIPLDELKKLVGFHILYYSFDKQKLSNFRPKEGDGASAEEKAVKAGEYYKFRTRSQDATSQVQPARMLSTEGLVVDTTGVTVDVYHQDRYIPVFSAQMFANSERSINGQALDAKSNYEYFFPDTEWKDNDGFCVANAAVTEYAIPTKNGYIYKVDRVIRPLETIHEELAKNADYSQYLALYDKYAYYDIDNYNTSTYGNGTKTYYQQRYQSPSGLTLPNIAAEWPSSDPLNIEELSSRSYSLFPPTNEAFDNFWRSYWGYFDGVDSTGYPTEPAYDQLSDEQMKQLLANGIYDQTIVFPEQITKGQVRHTVDGLVTKISFPVNDVPVNARKMCVNGVFYGQSTLTPPPLFGSVTGPAYMYKRYNIFLQMLRNLTGEQKSLLIDDDIHYIMLYPDDEQFRSNNIWWNGETQQILTGVPDNMTAPQSGVNGTIQRQYVFAHLIDLKEQTGELPTGGTDLHVYKSSSTDYNIYMYVRGGKITNSFTWSNLLLEDTLTVDDVFYDFEEIKYNGHQWSNGHAYKYDVANKAKLLRPSPRTDISEGKFVTLMYDRRGYTSIHEGFARILVLSGLYNAQRTLSCFTNETEKYTMLIPTTDAVKAAIAAGTFPHVTGPTDVNAADFFSQCAVKAGEETALQHYLMQYFMPMTLAKTTEYPYPGWNVDIETLGGNQTVEDADNSTFTYVNIKEENGILKAWVKPQGSGTPKVVEFDNRYSYLPFVFEDGGVQFLNGIFADEWPNQ